MGAIGKRISLLLGMLFVVVLVFLPMRVGGEGCIFPTVPAEVSYPPGWLGELKIQAEGDGVSRNTDVDMWVDPGGLSCPPYTWTVSGQGFSLYVAQTGSDLDVNALQAGGNACGIATVRVVDSCGRQGEVKIRCVDSGKWVFKETLCACGALMGNKEILCNPTAFEGIRYYVIVDTRNAAELCNQSPVSDCWNDPVCCYDTWWERVRSDCEGVEDLYLECVTDNRRPYCFHVHLEGNWRHSLRTVGTYEWRCP